MTKKSTKKHYVDNKAFYECIKSYKQAVKEAEEQGKQKPRIPEYAGLCIQLIAENMAKRYYKFARYSYNDEMVSDSVLNCIKYFDNFDETKFNNPHAYFTQICYQANVQRVKIEKKNQYIKYKTFSDEMILSSDPDIVFHDRHGLIEKEVYDNMSVYIEDFETKEEDRREKRKEKIREKKMRDSLERFFEDDD